LLVLGLARVSVGALASPLSVQIRSRVADGQSTWVSVNTVERRSTAPRKRVGAIAAVNAFACAKSAAAMLIVGRMRRSSYGLAVDALK
jgi:hypothetical protein